MKNQAGICSVTFRNKSVEELLKFCKGNGLTCIEWGGDVHVPPNDLENAKKVRALSEIYGVQCSSYGSYFKCRKIEDFEAISRHAEALGAKVIRIWAGEKNSEDCYCSIGEYNQIVEMVKQCADIAKKRGQTVAFEYHHSTCCNYAGSVLKLLSDIGKDNVKTYWQPMYWLKSASEEEERVENLRSIRLLKGYIQNVHVYKWRYHERHALKGSEEEWKEYVKEMGGVKNYYLEFCMGDSEEQCKQDALVLKEILKGNA